MVRAEDDAQELLIGEVGQALQTWLKRLGLGSGVFSRWEQDLT